MNRELWKELRDKLMTALNEQGHTSDEELYDMIDGHILEYGRSGYLPLKDRMNLRISLFDSFRRLGVLQELVDDPEVTEIMVNGAERIFVERKGRMEAWNKSFENVEQLEDMIQQIVSRVNRVVNVSRPVADARLPDGSRVHIVLPPVALDGPSVTIRKFPEPITMDKLIRFGSLTDEAAGFLKKLVEAGYNIFICGGTNSGKSTFLNALSACIPAEERLVTIEDSAELQLRNVLNIVRLETRGPNGEGEGAVTIGDLIRAALRMNPDRIIVGEVRGSEAVDMISAMNTGHDGSLSTGHGNNPRDMLSRLETMMLMGAELPLPAIRSQLASALDVMIHLGRLRDRSRRVLSIVEVESYVEGEIRLNPLYEFEEAGLEPADRKEIKEMVEIKGTEDTRAEETGAEKTKAEEARVEEAWAEETKAEETGEEGTEETEGAKKRADDTRRKEEMCEEDSGREPEMNGQGGIRGENRQNNRDGRYWQNRRDEEQVRHGQLGQKKRNDRTGQRRQKNRTAQNIQSKRPGQEVRAGHQKQEVKTGQSAPNNRYAGSGQTGRKDSVCGCLKKVGTLKNTEKLRAAAISL